MTSLDFNSGKNTVILDYGGIMIPMTNVKISNSNNDVSLLFDFLPTDTYNTFNKFFEQVYNELNDMNYSGYVSKYKTTVRIIMNQSFITCYNSFVHSMDLGEDGGRVGVDLIADYSEFNYDNGELYDNYTTILRKYKLRKIQSKIKKNPL